MKNSTFTTGKAGGKRKFAWHTFLIVLLFFFTGQAYAQAPAWLWALQAGGSDADHIIALTTDAQGNIYATGSFMSTEIILGDYTLTNQGTNFNVFIAKFDPEGKVLWAHSAGGHTRDVGSDVVVDKEGNVYLTGRFESPSITFGSYTFYQKGGGDIFLVKYDPDGNVIWALHEGGNDWDYAYAMALDTSDNIYLAGRSSSPVLTFRDETLYNTGLEDIFLVKYNTLGEVLWAKRAGGSNRDYAWGVTTDMQDNVLITGSFNSSSLNFGTTILYNETDENNAFTAKFDKNGNALWAVSTQGIGDDRGHSVATDVQGNVFVGGYYNSPHLYFGEESLTNLTGGSDSFLAKYDAQGEFIWVTHPGGNDDNLILSVNTDASGNVLVAGRFNGTFNYGSTTLHNPGPESDLFVALYDTHGSPLWADGAGGTDFESAYATAQDATGNIYVGGISRSEEIQLGSHVLTNTTGSSNMLLAKLDGGPVPAPQQLTATPLSGSEVLLNWKPNAAGNIVMLAYSEDGVFGTPANEYLYSRGETLPGGGTVLYMGTEESLLHSELQGLTKYYYRAWSYNIYYSSAGHASATTLCHDATPLPFSENFDTASTLPVCWSVAGSNITPDENWKVGTFANGVSGTTGNYARAEIAGNAQKSAALVSPTFDFTGYSEVQLTFMHRYNHSHSAATLEYRTNSSPWTELQSWEANTGSVAFSSLLQELDNRAGVQFRWVLQTRGSGPPHAVRSWSVDDVQLTANPAEAGFTITASATAGGFINPSGVVWVGEGESQTFHISPDVGFAISDVVVDNESAGVVSTYTFTGVTANHSILAVFEEIPRQTFTITATAGPGGTIDPHGAVEVYEGDSQSFFFFAQPGFTVADVVVDNQHLGPLTSYTFNNVAANHEIFASFEALPDDPCRIAVLPYLQDFNAEASLPGCWESRVNTGNTSWKVGALSGNFTGTTGNYAYFYYQGNQSQDADLISPPFDFTGYTNVSLSFTHLHNASRSSACVYFSLDAGNSWQAIQTWSSSTSGAEHFSATLPALDGQAHVLFRWNVDFSGGGPPRNSRSWSIDDVLVSAASARKAGGNTTQSNLLLTEEALAISTFPNPVREQLSITVNRDIESGVLRITDMRGSVMYLEQISGINAGGLWVTSTEGWLSGTYIVTIVTPQEAVNRLILKK